MVDRVEIGGLPKSVERIRREEEFPEDPQKRFEAIFAAVGNSEAKCVTLLCMSESTITGGDLHTKFIDAASRTWVTAKSVPSAWSRYSLVPIGLVAEVDKLQQGLNEHILGFRLTEAGRKYGQPIAAYLLEKSSKMDLSFGQLFGTSSIGSGEKNRPVINRVNILEFLANAGRTVRREDIRMGLGLNETSITNHMVDMSNMGLVVYDSADIEGNGWSRYSLVAEADRSQVTQYRYQKSMTELIANIVWELGEVDLHSVVDELKKNNVARNSSDHSLKVIVAGMLGHLERSGFLRRMKFRGCEEMSQATITESGNKLVEEIILPVKAALSDDEVLQSFNKVDWIRFAPGVVAKYKNSSPYANRRSKEDRASELYSFISENPGVRLKELKKQFGRNADKIIDNMLKAGVIRIERGKRAVKYFVN